jgi:Zn ribbon nucleic-acid-binding protein
MQTDLVEIQNIPCTVCQECGHEQIGQRIQKQIDKLLERAAKGRLKTRVVVM